MRFIGVYINRKVYPLCLYCKKIMWHGQRTTVVHSCRQAPKGASKHKDLTDQCPEVYKDEARKHWSNYEDAVMHGERLVPAKEKPQKVE